MRHLTRGRRRVAAARKKRGAMSRPSPARLTQAVLIFVLALLAASVTGTDRQTQVGPRLARIIAPIAETSFVGLYVGSLTRGHTLCAISADRPFLPASNEKLETSVTALEALGAGRRFTTTVLAAATPDKEGA